MLHDRRNLLFGGRTPDAQRRLHAALVREFSTCGVPATDLAVIVHDVSRENWGAADNPRQTSILNLRSMFRCGSKWRDLGPPNMCCPR